MFPTRIPFFRKTSKETTIIRQWFSTSPWFLLRRRLHTTGPYSVIHLNTPGTRVNRMEHSPKDAQWSRCIDESQPDCGTIFPVPSRYLRKSYANGNYEFLDYSCSSIDHIMSSFWKVHEKWAHFGKYMKNRWLGNSRILWDKRSNVRHQELLDKNMYLCLFAG